MANYHTAANVSLEGRCGGIVDFAMLSCSCSWPSKKASFNSLNTPPLVCLEDPLRIQQAASQDPKQILQLKAWFTGHTDSSSAHLNPRNVTDKPARNQVDTAYLHIATRRRKHWTSSALCKLSNVQQRSSIFNETTSHRPKKPISELLNKQAASKCYEQICKLMWNSRQEKEKTDGNTGWWRHSVLILHPPAAAVRRLVCKPNTPNGEPSWL